MAGVMALAIINNINGQSGNNGISISANVKKLQWRNGNNENENAYQCIRKCEMAISNGENINPRIWPSIMAKRKRKLM